jgi:hypothetical protein
MLRAPLASFRDDLMRRRFFIDAMLSLLHSKVEFSLSHARFPIAAIFFLPHLHVSRIQQNVNCDPGQVDNIKYDAHRNTPLQPDTHTQIRVEWGGGSTLSRARAQDTFPAKHRRVPSDGRSFCAQNWRDVPALRPRVYKLVPFLNEFSEPPQ